MSDRITTAFPRIGQKDGAATLAATLALAGLCWIVALSQMRGMDMGAATVPGAFPLFLGRWVPMTAAMMLPGAVPTAVKRVRSGGAPLPFVAAYLAAWAVVGIAIYPAYRPHGSAVASAIVIAAGVYEFTPLKSRCRQRCRETTRSGEYALCCIGSSMGLMLMLLALGPMSIAWMSIITGIALVQRLVPTRPAVDVPIALAIIGLGLLIVFAPGFVPGLMPSMSMSM